MSLLTRLVDPQEGEQKIPVHQFMAGIAEFARGAPGVTANSLAQAFNLDAGELAALTAWYTSEILTGNLSREEVHDALLLGEADRLDGGGKMYPLQAVMNRLNL